MDTANKKGEGVEKKSKEYDRKNRTVNTEVSEMQCSQRFFFFF